MRPTDIRKLKVYIHNKNILNNEYHSVLGIYIITKH